MAEAGIEVPRAAGGPAGWISILIPVTIFAYLVQFVPQVAAGEVILWAYEWVPALDIRLSVILDGLSLTFALLISGIGALVTLYSSKYLGNHPEYPRFVLYLMAFMGGMLGLVLADNLIALFVFWEVTTISSYLLIGFNSDEAKSRRSALQALLVTGTGGLALLAGIIMLGNVAGSFELSVILTQGDMIRAHPLYVPIVILFLAGAFTKSAQFPFHFWLPNAMAAPTPVSAYLHSATMVKAGVFLMARMNPALGSTDLWFWTLVIAGGFTAVFASILAMRQTDIKQVLAYTTLMALGTLTLFIGAGTSDAIKGMMLFLVVHSLYKAALFLMIGIVDHATGTREAEVLRGLGRKMPITALAAVMAAVSMAGIPPLVGFIGKEFLYKAGLELDQGMIWVTGAAFAASALMFAVAGIVALRPFFGPLAETPKPAHEGPVFMLTGPLVLAGLSLFFGLFPDTIEAWLVAPGTWAVYGSPDVDVDLYLFEEVNAAFILSLITFATGAVIYAVHRPLRSFLARLFEANPIKFDPGWDGVLEGLKALAAWQTRHLQSGVLQRYLFVIFATLAVLSAITIWSRDVLAFDLNLGAELDGLLFKHWAVLVFVAAGSILTAFTSSRMTAIASLGVVGIGVALIFIMFSAPDVAITQLLVETLVVVLVAVAMLKLPRLEIMAGHRDKRPWHAVVAVSVGLVTTAILIAVLQGDIDRRLTDYFEVTSWPEAYGRNIVNVILVDFRALDTFGEIAVVMIAALAAYALLRGTYYGRPKDAREEDGQ
ncbi:putative monovalent cation/H+ antiporter subunit A [Roseobacter sp. HKCCD9010]|uniref:putative monovalent cation/H+ antiporter subunit A n=1 Tax=unclassified Roseobacter TaxID=196798 RepID=UPI0014932008|nr:putative monovalent cation/H+ antiporter subunit A [Rhodobacterales bacterium HKCCD4356]NNV10849.1 putative monovalent cation/H+ antiporter subunit A [Roseobacter sp. HKCCD7357]NNV15034.1 putative monovalent cation/H+ antiporter subunit A [Roseobacter sp. HKCCD8768]NNV24493.1 putative monovalent cation/H+ antiporter subunit A [Roseobacter sp. HKCCD8192]NNV28750.1 putative monovalent cation/H+ antiporter subunit A [Roseobacter sp. HKCCD9061]NNV33023.1 putative monovalent cation/H+ antiporter